ncbi:MAG TPA: DUF177 domain-containing protein [Cyclobacteriaceae bacterium]|nr:DUF177 domain-containing protein [Cyclobacteriaceae bacterium]
MARDFCVNILGLGKGVHQFEFQMEETFFKAYGQEVVGQGKLSARVVLDKKETFIEADFTIEGNASLICDRSLEAFDFPLSISRKVVFKYGEEPREVSDEIVIIAHDQPQLDIGQFIYEFIVLEIPIKKLHPRFKQEPDDDREGKIIYTSSTGGDEDVVDPRWEVLKKLK